MKIGEKETVLKLFYLYTLLQNVEKKVLCRSEEEAKAEANQKFTTSTSLTENMIIVWLKLYPAKLKKFRF